MSWKLTYLLSPIFLLVLLFHVNGQTNFLKGIEAYNQKDYNLAALNFEKEVKSNNQNVAAWYNLGLSNIGKKNVRRSHLQFRKSFKIYSK